MADVSFKKFKPKGFIPSSSSRFYVEILGFGEQVQSLENYLIYTDSEKKRFLVKSVDFEEGNIEVGSIDYFSFFNIEYPRGWKKPTNGSITFIDNQQGNIYKFFHKWAKLAGITRFVGIKPTNLHNYSISFSLNRYDYNGDDQLVSNFTIFPKTLPKWVNDYENNSLQAFDVEFIIVDWDLQFV